MKLIKLSIVVMTLCLVTDSINAAVLQPNRSIQLTEAGQLKAQGVGFGWLGCFLMLLGI